MAIINLFMSNWDNLVLIVLTLAVLIFAYIRGKKPLVYKILYGLVTEAEKQFKGKTGELKQSIVFGKVYEALPAMLKTFIPKSLLEKWVDDAVELAKEKWSNNESVMDYIKGGK